MNVNQLTLEEKIGQMIIAGFPTSSTLDTALNYALEHLKIGNFILFTPNIKDTHQVAALTDYIQKKCTHNHGIPAFITIDQEGGMVTRIKEGITFLPGAMAISATNRVDAAYTVGKISGEELRALGINVNLAPVLDVNSNPLNPVIGVRAYSDNPRMVAAFGVPFMRGLQEQGVIATAKHFPGHGDTTSDSHKALPTVDKSFEMLENIELYPFKMAIANGIDAIMTSHILFPQVETSGVPCTMSSKILTEILRKKLGFEGLIITDCMEMGAIKNYYGTVEGVIKAVKAGADLIHISHSIDVQEKAVIRLKEAVKSGEIDENIIDVAVQHILKIKQKYKLFESCASHVAELRPEKLQLNQRFANQLSEESITLLKDEKGYLPLLKNEGNLFLSPRPVIWVGIEDHLQADMVWCEKLANHFKDKAMIYNLDPSDDEVEVIVESCKQVNKIIIGTYNAPQNRGQIKLVKRLYEENHKIITISLRNPYDIMFYQAVPCHICTYEYTPGSIESIQKVLEGTRVAKGILPVTLKLDAQ